MWEDPEKYQHEGPIIPDAEKRVYAYQGESITIRGQVSAFESNHLDTHEWKKLQDCHEMRLEITRGAERSVDVSLSVKPTNEQFIEQRIKDGAGVIQTKYWTSMSFGELVIASSDPAAKSLWIGRHCQIRLRK